MVHEVPLRLTINIESCRKLEKSISVTCNYKNRYHNARKSVALLSQTSPNRFLSLIDTTLFSFALFFPLSQLC